MRSILSLTILITNLRGTPYGLTYDIYENYYDYGLEDNNIDTMVITPQFITQPLNMIVNSGKTAKLPCIVDRLEGFVLLWKKNDQIISVGQQMLDKYNTKHHIEPVTNGNYLMVSGVEPGDEGNYTCAVSTVKKEELSHYLRVRIAPSISTEPQELVTVEEGDSLQLQCKVLAGSPTPSLRWRQCGGSVVSELGVLSLQEVGRHQAGCYACEADNGFSVTPVTKEVTLIVQYPPDVSVDKIGDSTEEEVSVVCRVEAQPPARVAVYREDRHGARTILYTDTGDTADNMEVEVAQDTTTYTLHLHHLQPDMFGDYVCSAENLLGEARARARVSGWPSITSVKISPSPAQSACYTVTVSLQSDSPVTRVGFLYSGPGLQETRASVVPSGQPPHTSVVSHRQCHLEFSSPYSVSVSASNRVGSSPATLYNFTTEHQSLLNLKWSGASSVSAWSVWPIVLIVQVGLLMRRRLE